MKCITKITAMGLLLLAGMGSAKAQDPHYTQYYVYPSWLNPALTGVFDGSARVSAIYRNQWGNIASPYQTPGVSADFNTNKNAAFGVSVLNQRAGDGGFNYTTAYASMAYSGVRFGANGYKRLNMGFQLGMIQRRFDISKMSFGEQWNPSTGYNPGAGTGESLSKTSATSFDAGVGVMYYDAEPGKKTNLFAGVSASHITRPTDQFSASGDAKIPVRYTGHAGLRIMINEVASITPNILYMRQGSAEEKMVGAYLQMNVAEDADFMIGANYRIKDAISPYIGVYVKEFLIGASYDVNTSDLGKMAKGSNSFELSLSYIFKRAEKTPEVKFICPRL
ncbi:PorP/SprF family type IX secretion system membrane protein [Chitinophagaceae bacterium 26-R-25]|nr:PorP/SprF family type IX secretion system membrane protein [Chitinophagaceae bacterium 26-R-25]